MAAVLKLGSMGAWRATEVQCRGGEGKGGKLGQSRVLPSILFHM